MKTVLVFLAAIVGVMPIDFRRDEVHKYFLPKKYGGMDICNQINCTMNADFGTVNFYLFTQYNRDVPILLTESNINNINPALETKVILHGWNEGYNATWVIDMKNTFLLVGDYNVILPDYYYYTSQTIMMGCCYSRSLSEVIGYFISQLPATIGLDLKKVHVIGASLGAQVAGMVGDTVKIYSRGTKVARITGLDTTYMLFRGRPHRDRLTPDDADFVDIIHTNSGDMGYPDPHGHIDFYPNCGITQPQCGNETGAIRTLCDHSMSHVFFNATIYYPTIYVAVECFSCDDFLAGRCNGNRQELMGESTPPTARGIYFISIYDDLRPLIINAINAGEFDDNPPPSLEGNQILEERRTRARENSSSNSIDDFFTTTTTSTTTETPVYPKAFQLSNLRVPGSAYRRGLTGLGTNPDPAGDRLRAQRQRQELEEFSSGGRSRTQDDLIDDYSAGQSLTDNRRFYRNRGVSNNRQGRRNNLSFPSYIFGPLKNYEPNASRLGAASKNDPYGSNTQDSTYLPPITRQFGNGYATPSPVATQGLPVGNPAVFNERYLANRFNYSLDEPVGPNNLPLDGQSPNQPLYRNSATLNQDGGSYYQASLPSGSAQVTVWRNQRFQTTPSYTDQVTEYGDYGYNSNVEIQNGEDGSLYQFYTTYNRK